MTDSDGVSGKRPPITLRSARRIGIVAAGSIAAHVGTSTIPFQVGALMDGLRMSAATAAGFGSAMVFGLAISMIVIAPWVARLRIASIALPGLLAAVAANLILFMGPSLAVTFLCGAVSGAGGGLIYAGALKLVSGHDDKQIVLPVATGLALAGVVAVIYGLPAIQDAAGVLGPFLLIALTVVSAGLLFCLLAGREMWIVGAPAAIVRRDAQAGLLTPANIALIIGWCLFSIGSAAAWTFVERIGRSIGISAREVSAFLSFATAFGIVGTLIVPLLTRWLGLTAALAGSVAINGIAAGLLAVAGSPPVYALAAIAYWTAQMASYACFLNAASAQDESGRLITLGSGAERLSYSAGTLVGGVLVAGFSYEIAGMFACGAGLAAAAIVIRSGAHVRRTG